MVDTPTYEADKLVRPEKKIVGDIYDKIHEENKDGENIPRANIPKEGVQDVVTYFTSLLKENGIFDEETLDSIKGIGSTRQYLEDDYQKPFAGDIDLIVRIPANKTEAETYIQKELLPKLEKLGLRPQYDLGNISVFLPLKHPDYDDLHIQIDIIPVPTSPGDELYTYWQEVLFYSGDEYKGQEGGGYLKGIHAAELFLLMNRAKGIRLTKEGIYEKNYIKQKDIKRTNVGELLQTLNQESPTRFGEKWAKNFDVVHAFGKKQVFDLSGKPVGINDDGKLGTNDIIFKQSYKDIYKSIRNKITTKKKIKTGHKKYFKKIFDIDSIRTFDEVLTLLKDKYEDGFYTKEEVQDIINVYAQKLIKKNKGKLRFPYVKERIHEALDIDRKRIDAFEVNHIEKKMKREL